MRFEPVAFSTYRCIVPSVSDLDHFNAAIVGLGRAGLGLHIPILHTLQTAAGDGSHFEKIVALVDMHEPAVTRAQQQLQLDFGYDPANLVCGTSLEAIAKLDRETTVVHVCTPEGAHLATLQQAAALGFHRFVIEKPCAGNIVDVDEMQRVVDQKDINVAIVNPYLYSRSVELCKRKISSIGEKPHYLEFELSKPRKRPTLQGRSSPESVIDVELPHQIATALYLTEAQHYRVLRTETRHMHYREEDTDPCKVIQNMGLGIIVLELDQTIAFLISYLDARTRTRVLKLRFSSTEYVEAFLPVSGEDHTSEFVEYAGRNSDGSTDQTNSQKFPDDLFAKCLGDIYSKFAAGQPHLSDIAFNRKVVDVMSKAKALAGLKV
jgi:predicted dehydrogenase